jgi:hypothetical protein
MKIKIRKKSKSRSKIKIRIDTWMHLRSWSYSLPDQLQYRASRVSWRSETQCESYQSST